MFHRLSMCLAFTFVAILPVSVNAATITGLTADNQLLTFNSSNSSVITNTVGVTGLGDYMLQDIDFRPSTKELYGVGVNGMGQGAIFKINTVTGQATSVGLTGSPFNLSGNIGIDFNPVPDALRVDTTADQNYRVTFATPTTNVNIDGNLAYAAGDVNFGKNPSITTIGYTNNFAGTTSTTLFGIDSNLNTLVRQQPPNNGVLNTVGSLGFNISGDSGFDITADNNAFIADLDRLYSLNLSTGQATFIGQIGSGSPDIIGLAVAVPEPSMFYLLSTGIAGLIAKRRFGPRK
ncbi:DUF4394 domain-containing protein [Schlesneria sp.]|uniref:DUF4394 domain-containing protein n=1 Tax=Schlesneria sp. TaxID=2762018 RepID=UPI002F00AACC